MASAAPSTIISEPVINVHSSDARNAIAAAISEGSANRLSGEIAATAAITNQTSGGGGPNPGSRTGNDCNFAVQIGHYVTHCYFFGRPALGSAQTQTIHRSA